jgi:hypothetical protein
MRTTPLYEREIVMLQQAIVFTKENASAIAETLIEYPTAQDLLADYEYMFNKDMPLVLGRDTMSDGVSVLSYVITESYFRANNPDIQLNDHTFVTVRQF